MAKKVLLKKGNTEVHNGWTSKVYEVARKDGKIGKRITLTNDYICIKSNYVNDAGNFFMLPNTQSIRENEEVRSYDNVKINDSTRQAVLLFGGEHQPLYTRKPDLDNYEIVLSTAISENQGRAGIVAKATLTGDDWEVPNIAIFKDGAGEITFQAPSGITIHPLVLMELGEYCTEALADIAGVTATAEDIAKYKAMLEEMENEETSAEEPAVVNSEEVASKKRGRRAKVEPIVAVTAEDILNEVDI